MGAKAKTKADGSGSGSISNSGSLLECTPLGDALCELIEDVLREGPDGLDGEEDALHVVVAHAPRD